MHSFLGPGSRIRKNGGRPHEPLSILGKALPENRRGLKHKPGEGACLQRGSHNGGSHGYSVRRKKGWRGSGEVVRSREWQGGDLPPHWQSMTRRVVAQASGPRVTSARGCC